MSFARANLPDQVLRLMPLTPAVFYVLLSLSSGEKHGYAIMQETTTLSDRRFRMGPATLYSTIQRLVALDLIEETAGRSGEDPRRRYYGLTTTGKRLLKTEVAHMNSVVQMANARLIPGAPRMSEK
jgi:DNA-binding PadR family transcriptional regulator